MGEENKPKPEAPALAGLPRDDEGPVFAAPWEAKIFALVHGLCQQGRYEWKDFQNHLIAEIAAGEARARQAGEEPPAYYDSFLAAGIRLLSELELIDPDEFETRSADLRH